MGLISEKKIEYLGYALKWHLERVLGFITNQDIASWYTRAGTAITN